MKRLLVILNIWDFGNIVLNNSDIHIINLINNLMVVIIYSQKNIT